MRASSAAASSSATEAQAATHLAQASTFAQAGCGHRACTTRQKVRRPVGDGCSAAVPLAGAADLAPALRQLPAPRQAGRRIDQTHKSHKVDKVV